MQNFEVGEDVHSVELGGAHRRWEASSEGSVAKMKVNQGRIRKEARRDGATDASVTQIQQRG